MLCTMCGVNEAMFFFTETDMYCSVSCKLAAWDIMMDGWDVDGIPSQYQTEPVESNISDPYDFDDFSFIDVDRDPPDDDAP